MWTIRLGRAASAALLVVLSLLPTAPTRAAPGGQIDPDVVVRITSPQPGQRLQGRVEITGYAADRRSPSGSGMNERDIQIFLNDSSDMWNLFDFALPGRDSPEAAAALGPQFDKAGFWDAWETCSFPEGPYKLIVWVSSLITPGARNFASIDVWVEPCPQGAIISEDDFSSRPGGVDTLRLEQPDTRVRLIDPIYADYAAGIDARCAQSGVDCRYALELRVLPGPGGTRTNSFYRFTVDPTDGSFTLGYSPPGDDPIVPIVPWTQSPAIRRGTATNRLAVIVQGNWLRLFINGQQVGEARDERRPWGQIGWTASTTANGPIVEVQFADFVVSTPGPAETLSTLFPRDAGSPSGAAPPPGPGPSTGAVPGPAAAPSRVLLRDDFSNPNSGWPTQSSDPTTRRVGYEGGEYYVVKLAGSSGAPFVTRSERFGDFQVEIDARLMPPTADAYLYIDFRRQDNGDHYSFVVDPTDGSFLLQSNTGSDRTSLISWTNAPAIAPGTARNRLGVRAQGPEIVLLVNGQEVGRARDERLREGSLAFGVGSLTDGPADGRFSNLLVTSLD